MSLNILKMVEITGITPCMAFLTRSLMKQLIANYSELSSKV